ncbi:WhiB family transcriptional regulator [Streptosporangium sandarakinum]
MSDWRHRAACKDLDPELFFTHGRKQPQVREACRVCPSLIPCTFDALRSGGPGYQAGLTGVERERIRAWDRRQRRRLAAQQKQEAAR